MKDKIIEIIHKYRPGWLDPSIAAQEIEDAIDETEIAKRVIEEFVGNYSGKHTYIDVKVLFDYLDRRE